MKTLLIIVVALVFTALAIPACSQSGTDSSGDSAAVDLTNTTKLNYTVTGMHCDSCAQAIAGEVKTIPGVATCEASFENGSLVVNAADAEADQAIRQAVAELGYGIEPASEAANGDSNESPDASAS